MIVLILSLACLSPIPLLKKWKWKAVCLSPILGFLLYFLSTSHWIPVDDLIRDGGDSGYVLYKEGPDHILICHGDPEGRYHLERVSLKEPELLVRFLELDNSIRISKARILCCYSASHLESSRCILVTHSPSRIYVDHYPRLGWVYWREESFLDWSLF